MANEKKSRKEIRNATVGSGRIKNTDDLKKVLGGVGSGIKQTTPKKGKKKKKKKGLLGVRGY